MTRKNAKKMAARTLQQKTGQKYESALRAQANCIEKNREGILRLFTQALDACSQQLDREKFTGPPTFSANIEFAFPDGHRIICLPIHDLKEPVPEDLQPYGREHVEHSTPFDDKKALPTKTSIQLGTPKRTV